MLLLLIGSVLLLLQLIFDKLSAAVLSVHAVVAIASHRCHHFCWPSVLMQKVVAAVVAGGC